MKYFQAFLAMTLLLGGGILSGCTLRVVNRPHATPVPTSTPVPFPYALQIEARVQEQVNRVAGYLQNGSLIREQADVLTDNTLLVRRFAFEFRAPSKQRLDLTPAQASLLSNMLDDNARFIDDALKRRQYWVSYFQAGSYNYTTVNNHYVYISYLDFQLKRQVSDVEAGLRSRKLTSTRARELRGRIKAVSDLKLNCYRVNGRMDLSEDQVRQLSQMAEDNANYIAFSMKKGKGRWNNARFTGWKKKKPQGLGQGQTANWGNSGNNEPPKPIATWTPTPLPVLTATPTSVPVPKPLTATPTPFLVEAVVAAPSPVPTSTPVPAVTSVVEGPDKKKDDRHDHWIKKEHDERDDKDQKEDTDDKKTDKKDKGEDRVRKDDKKEHDDERESGKGKKLGHEKQKDHDEKDGGSDDDKKDDLDDPEPKKDKKDSKGKGKKKGHDKDGKD